MNTATKRGNPNFGRKEESSDVLTATPKATSSKPKKGMYRFVLIESFDLLKPRDKKTGEVVDNPYPPLYIIPNSGVAYNTETNQTEEWRFLHGYNSIWVKDQEKPKPSKDRLNNSDGKNTIEFRDGHLKVFANEEAKLQALLVQDIYNGIGDLQIVPRPFVYRLIDEEKQAMEVRDMADEAYEAEKLAREAKTGEMLSTAMAFGMDIQDVNDAEDPKGKLRTQFIAKARSNPSLFRKVFQEPKNRIKYYATRALGEGILAIEDNVLKYDGKPVMQVNPTEDVAEQVAVNTLSNDANCISLYEGLKKMYLL